MAQMMLVNPRKRRARRKTTAKKRKSPVRRRRTTTLARVRRTSPARRRRRNPIKMNLKNVMKTTVMPSVTAAGGAIGVDVLLGFADRFLPAQLTTGPVRHVVKGVAAIGMGLLASNFVKPKTAELFATGAMTVAIYGAGREMLGRFAPQITLGEFPDMDTDDMGYPSPGLVVGDDSDIMGYYESEAMGAYDDDDIDI